MQTLKFRMSSWLLLMIAAQLSSALPTGSYPQQDDVAADVSDVSRPSRSVDNTGFQPVPEVGYSDFNYDNPLQGNTVYTFGYRVPPHRVNTPSGYDYSSIIAPGYNDPYAEPVYGVSKKYPSHIKSALKGLTNLYILDKKLNYATSNPSWNYGQAPLAKHAVQHLASQPYAAPADQSAYQNAPYVQLPPIPAAAYPAAEAPAY